MARLSKLSHFAPYFATMSISCSFCDRTGFTCQRALTQHQQRNPKCHARLLVSLGVESGYTTAHEFFSDAKANEGCNNHDLAKLAPDMFHRSSRLGAMQVHYDILKRKVLLNMSGYQTAREVESDADNEQSDDDGAMILDDNEEEEGGADGAIGEEQPTINFEPDQTTRANFIYYRNLQMSLLTFYLIWRH